MRPNRVCPDKYINTWPNEPSFKLGKFGLADQTLSKTNTTAASARQICPIGSVPPWQFSSHKCFPIYFVFSLPLRMCLCYSLKCWCPPHLQKRKGLLFECLVQEEGWFLNIPSVWFVTTCLCSYIQCIFFSTVSKIMDKIQQGELQTQHLGSVQVSSGNGCESDSNLAHMHIAALLSSSFLMVLQDLAWFTLKGRQNRKEGTEAGIILLDTLEQRPLKQSAAVILFYRDFAPSRDKMHIVSLFLLHGICIWKYNIYNKIYHCLGKRTLSDFI